MNRSNENRKGPLSFNGEWVYFQGVGVCVCVYVCVCVWGGGGGGGEGVTLSNCFAYIIMKTIFFFHMVKNY